jgi:hypothetical protein
MTAGASTRRRLALSLAVMALAAVAVGLSEFSSASFTAGTENPNNAFTAADSFLRLSSGSYVGNGTDNRTITGAGFQPDLVIVKGDNNQFAVLRSSTMSGDATKSTGALEANLIQSLDANGFTIGTDSRVNRANDVYYWTALKADSTALKVGTYTGNGTSKSITGLGFSPEYVATMSAGTDKSVQRFAGMTSAFDLANDTGGSGRITSLDADGFSVGNSATANASGVTYHYLAFNGVSGTVKTGSYSGNGSDNRSITGAGFRPGWVLLRANDTSTGRLALHRPAALGGDSTQLFINNTLQANMVQALEADGFQVGGSGHVNASGVTYHYLAVTGSGS